MKEQIIFVQMALSEALGGRLKADGIAGPKTMAAIDLFLSAKKVETWMWSDQRKIVGALQVIINVAGNAPDRLKVDGFYGYLTEFAFEATIHYTVTRTDLPAFRSAEDEYGFDTNPKYPVDWGKGDYASLVDRYGDPLAPDFAQKHLVMFETPYPLRIGYEPSKSTQRITCHREVYPVVYAILTEVHNEYGIEQIEQLGLNIYDGCYNLRKMRGGNELSKHSWALPFDWDAKRNGLHTKWKDAQFSKPAYTRWNEIWYDYGFINLGKERDYDAMHYQPAFTK